MLAVYSSLSRQQAEGSGLTWIPFGRMTRMTRMTFTRQTLKGQSDIGNCPEDPWLTTAGVATDNAPQGKKASCIHYTSSILINPRRPNVFQLYESV